MYLGTSAPPTTQTPSPKNRTGASHSRNSINPFATPRHLTEEKLSPPHSSSVFTAPAPQETIMQQLNGISYQTTTNNSDSFPSWVTGLHARSAPGSQIPALSLIPLLLPSPTALASGEGKGMECGWLSHAWLLLPRFTLKFNFQPRDWQGVSLAEPEVLRWQRGVIQSGSIQRPLLEIVEQSGSLQGIHREQEENLHQPGFCWCFTGMQLQKHWWDNVERLLEPLLRVGWEPQYLPRSLIASLRTSFIQGSCVWLRYSGV